MKKNRAYLYKLKPAYRSRQTGKNEKLKHAAALLSLVAVEALLMIEYLNQCINQIINN